jgi:hypothetical protein
MTPSLRVYIIPHYKIEKPLAGKFLGNFFRAIQERKEGKKERKVAGMTGKELYQKLVRDFEVGPILKTGQKI